MEFSISRPVCTAFNVASIFKTMLQETDGLAYSAFFNIPVLNTFPHPQLQLIFACSSCPLEKPLAKREIWASLS